MSESDILGWFKIPSHLEVVKALEKAPKSSKEIAKIANITETGCADVLDHLERSQAVEYVGNGWKLTEIGQRVLEKYFK